MWVSESEFIRKCARGRVCTRVGESEFIRKSTAYDCVCLGVCDGAGECVSACACVYELVRAQQCSVIDDLAKKWLIAH